MISLYIAWFFRLLTEHLGLVSTIVFGLILLDRKIFKYALYLFLTSILYSYALKYTFQIPLDPALQIKGFAFPSGHTVMRLPFYGLLAYHMKSYWHLNWILYSIIMLGNGYCLLFFGFHNYIDILAGYFFGSLLLICYIYLMKQTDSFFFLTLVSFNTALMIYISFLAFPHFTQFIYYCILMSLLFLQFFRTNTPSLLTLFCCNTALISYVFISRAFDKFFFIYYCIFASFFILKLSKTFKNNLKNQKNTKY